MTPTVLAVGVADWIGLVLAIALCILLLAVLVAPERFR